MVNKYIYLTVLLLTMSLANAGGAGGSWGEPTQPTKPATTNDTGDYTGGGGKFGGTGAGGSWGGDYTGGGGSFPGSGAGGSWSDNSSTTTSGSSCSPDGWEFEYIVLKDRKSFRSLEQACRYVWSNSFLNKYGLKETRMSAGEMRGKYYRKIQVIDDWSARCYVNTGYKNTNYDNNIGGSVDQYNVSKYYVGKVEICEPETMPPIPNFPMPPASGGGGSGGSDGGSGGSGTGSNGNGSNTNNYNYTTNNYKWDITTNNYGISDDKINQLIIAIKNHNVSIDLDPLLLAINNLNKNISNLSFQQVLNVEVDLQEVINAIKSNKYDDAELQAKIDNLRDEIIKTNAKLDEIINLLKRPQQCSTNSFNTKICDFIDWWQGDLPPIDDNSSVHIDDGHLDWQSIAERNYLTLPSSCPFNPLFNVPFLGKAASIVFPMDVVCRGAVMLKVLILLWASFTSLRIIGETPL